MLSANMLVRVNKKISDKNLKENFKKLYKSSKKGKSQNSSGVLYLTLFWNNFKSRINKFGSSEIFCLLNPTLILFEIHYCLPYISTLANFECKGATLGSL
jgi:hypothetical protein